MQLKRLFLIEIQDSRIEKFFLPDRSTNKLKREYLTGFHKRKLERQKKAKEFQEEQARLAKIEERKQIKLQREEDLLEQMKKYSSNLKELSGVIEDDDEEENKEEDEKEDKKEGVKVVEVEEDEWNGFEDDKPKGILKKHIYSNNEDETEVLIEDFSNRSIEDIAKSNYVNLAKSQEVLEKSIKRAKEYAQLEAEATNRKRKKKFRYLTKNERKKNNKRK